MNLQTKHKGTPGYHSVYDETISEPNWSNMLEEYSKLTWNVDSVRKEQAVDQLQELRHINHRTRSDQIWILLVRAFTRLVERLKFNLNATFFSSKDRKNLTWGHSNQTLLDSIILLILVTRTPRAKSAVPHSKTPDMKKKKDAERKRGDDKVERIQPPKLDSKPIQRDASVSNASGQDIDYSVSLSPNWTLHPS